MKKIILSTCMAVLTVATTMAQLKEGHVKYSVDVTSDNPDMAMAVSMMQGTELEMFFKDDLTRTDISMGAMMSIMTIVDTDGGDVLMLMGGMMGNKAIVSTTDELKEISDGEEQPEMEVTLHPNVKSREIQGYTCKKATLTNEDGDDMIYWYTEDIVVKTEGQNYLNDDIPGFPMEFEQTANGMNMKFTVTEFNKTIGKDAGEVFDMEVPEGYEEMTMEQLQNMGM